MGYWTVVGFVCLCVVAMVVVMYGRGCVVVVLCAVVRCGVMNL